MQELLLPWNLKEEGGHDTHYNFIVMSVHNHLKASMCNQRELQSISCSQARQRMEPPFSGAICTGIDR